MTFPQWQPAPSNARHIIAHLEDFGILLTRIDMLPLGERRIIIRAVVERDMFGALDARLLFRVIGRYSLGADCVGVEIVRVDDLRAA